MRACVVLLFCSLSVPLAAFAQPQLADPEVPERHGNEAQPAPPVPPEELARSRSAPQLAAYLVADTLVRRSTSSPFAGAGRVDGGYGLGVRFEKPLVPSLSLGLSADLVWLGYSSFSFGRTKALDLAVWFKVRHIARTRTPGVVVYGAIPVGFSWTFGHRERGINTGLLAGLEIVLGRAVPFVEVGGRLRWLNDSPDTFSPEQQLTNSLRIHVGVAVRF